MLSTWYLYNALQFAVFSYVVCVLLTKQNYILEWYYDILIKIHAKAKWLAYPLGYCEKCFAGQLSFWWWLIEHKEEYVGNVLDAFIRHMFFTAFTIFFTFLIKRIITKWM